MKALSIRQPWAWLIVNGHKDIENREWRTNFRGEFLVHAGATMTRGDYEACCLFCSGIAWGDYDFGNEFFFPQFDELQAYTGGIVGVATLVDCVTESDSPWFVGPVGFKLTGAKAAPFRPCKGALKFFEIPECGVAA